jgi:hypothetical protein
VIVDDFYLGALVVPPQKANTPLVVDPDAMLTRTFTLQHFQTIRGRDAQVIQALGGVYHSQLATGDRLNLAWEPERRLALPDAFGFLVREATDHVEV